MTFIFWTRCGGIPQETSRFSFACCIESRLQPIFAKRRLVMLIDPNEQFEAIEELLRQFENISLDTVLATESELCCLKDSQSKACESILTRSRNRLLACFFVHMTLYWVQGAKVG
eukprot:symbB.v1.2.032404.t1/scaffold3890.1/size48796/2